MATTSRKFWRVESEAQKRKLWSISLLSCKHPFFQFSSPKSSRLAKAGSPIIITLTKHTTIYMTLILTIVSTLIVCNFLNCCLSISCKYVLLQSNCSQSQLSLVYYLSPPVPFLNDFFTFRFFFFMIHCI